MDGSVRTCASFAPVRRLSRWLVVIWISFAAAGAVFQSLMFSCIGVWLLLKVMLISEVVSQTVASGRVQENFQAFTMFFCFFSCIFFLYLLFLFAKCFFIFEKTVFDQPSLLFSIF